MSDSLQDVRVKPCAIDSFQRGLADIHSQGRWANWYLYNLSLNELIQNHPLPNKELLLGLSFDGPFLGGFPYYLVILGPSKAYYFGQFNMPSEPYLELCRNSFDRMLPLFKRAGGRFAPFVLTFEARKQIAVFFTVGEGIDAKHTADEMNRIVIETLSPFMTRPGMAFPSLAALSGPITHLSDIRSAYCEACELSDLFFFEHGPATFTKKILCETRQSAEYETVLEKCQTVMNLLETGNSGYQKQFEEMVSYTRSGLSLARMRDALSYLRSRALMLCQVYNTGAAPEDLFEIASYLTIEDCQTALDVFFKDLFDVIISQGGHSHSVLRALYAIHRHYMFFDLSVAQIADYAHVTPSYLSRVFKDEMGVVPVEYIAKYRLRQSCRLLECTDDKIVSISQAVGFTDVKYFSRMFKQSFAQTPQQYRDASRMNDKTT